MARRNRAFVEDLDDGNNKPKKQKSEDVEIKHNNYFPIIRKILRKFPYFHRKQKTKLSAQNNHFMIFVQIPTFPSGPL